MTDQREGLREALTAAYAFGQSNADPRTLDGLLAALPSSPQPDGLDVPESSKVPLPDPTTPLGWALLMVGSFTVKDDSGNLCTMILGDRDNVARRMEAWLAQHPAEAARLAPPPPEPTE